MTDRPILFSALMIRALLAGTKTQTRRILNPQPYPLEGRPGYWNVSGSIGGRICVSDRDLLDLHRKARPGDRLWVRETWQGLTFGDFRPTKHQPCEVRYAATDPCADLDTEARGYPWRPSIFMPRWASRITLNVTDVRVERLQDISRGDAMDEGCPFQNMATIANPRDWFRLIWAEINSPGAWDANPWVAAYTFTVALKNIDEVGR